jgi:hypothetical protein
LKTKKLGEKHRQTYRHTEKKADFTSLPIKIRRNRQTEGQKETKTISEASF